MDLKVGKDNAIVSISVHVLIREVAESQQKKR